MVSREDRDVAKAAVEYIRAGDMIRALERAGRRPTNADLQRASEAALSLNAKKRVRELRQGKK